MPNDVAKPKYTKGVITGQKVLTGDEFLTLEEIEENRRIREIMAPTTKGENIDRILTDGRRKLIKGGTETVRDWEDPERGIEDTLAMIGGFFNKESLESFKGHVKKEYVDPAAEYIKSGKLLTQLGLSDPQRMAEKMKVPPSVPDRYGRRYLGTLDNVAARAEAKRRKKK